MIPKVIHYCWFGRNPLPPLAIKCIESWKKFFPNYEIKEWNEDNFDVNIIPYTAEAYKAKKYAFVSDYARFWILYNYGGIYFDTDVEVIKPMDDIINRGSFMGCGRPYNSKKSIDCGSSLAVAPGLGLGTNSGSELYKDFLISYEKDSFILSNGELNLYTIVHRATNILCKKGLMNVPEIQECAGVWIYPVDYFNPISVTTHRLKITKNTRSIHHYMASWSEKTFKQKILEFIQKILPESFLLWWHDFKHKSK